MNQEKVSVVLAVFNGADTLSETIKSILGQTYKDLELLIVDDESTDDSAKIIKETKDLRVKYFTLDQKNTGGPAAGRNRGIKESAGEFIAFCDQDDIWLPEKLEKQIGVYKNSKNKDKIGIIISSADLIDHSGKVINKNPVPFDGFLNKKEAFRKLILGDFITACTAVVPKKILDEMSSLDENMKGVDDYDLWLKITQKYGISAVPEVLAVWRQETDALSADKSKLYLETEKVFAKLKDTSEEIKIGHGKNLMRIFVGLLLQRKYKEAKNITEKIKEYPISTKAKIIIKLFRISPSLTGALLRLADKIGQISL